ncbi:ABC transporter permease [Sporolactobacillus laevolacticus]|uniref:Uncharacterized protein n=1 Tax=Sporolactobacillus laevolacticus DSM 442 TaxID=1395513 RepID=V6J336_9BACL|nr:ABC transporter permease [Sporolactobacillus laevolacticus]EST13651.1 hypothetical protein P343_00325 [Sporolactobacillus laevolacticus DSM 442]
MLLLSSGGNFRTYLLEADKLFLIQKRGIIRQLKLRALFFSLVQNLVWITLIFLLALPILVQVFRFSVPSIIYLYLAFCSFKLIILTLKKYISRPLYQKIIVFFTIDILTILFSFVDPSVYGICGALFTLLLAYLQFRQASSIKGFIRELEIEDLEANKYIRFVMNFSIDVEKPPKTRSRKPLILFRKSKRMFKVRSKENGLLELVLKVFLRDGSVIRSYIQFIILTSIALCLLPLVIKWLMFAAFLFFLNLWLNLIFKRIMENEFLYVVPYDQKIEGPVWARFKRWIIIPSTVWTGGLILLLTVLKFM